ncbi:hypothetical protein Leryth_007843 [Lithospermum erythrorhizon]|nr:hypothetical protein Leryth_007843 [Lithospermum erythrorhizon]
MFVYVMAEGDNRYVAYLEDMYEDKKCQKKVKVRWFHHNREVRGVVALQNPHPKEVFMTPHVQVISAECVDGPAVVLTRAHYEKCSTILPDDLLGKMQFCFRQFKSHRLKPFKLCKLRGYYDQPIFSYFNPEFFKDEEVTLGDGLKVGKTRSRSCSMHQLSEKEPLYQKLRYDIYGKRLDFQKHVGEYNLSGPTFKVNDKIEFLCQDSGIRGCWFKCIILEVSRKHVKIQYDDLKDEDGFSSLEEWIPVCRLASPDKLGIRCSGRPTIRPARPCQQDGLAIMAGTPVDAWWCDGWWEGFVVGSINFSDTEGFQVYSPGENLLLHVAKSNLRVSRDWVGDQWVDIDINPDILAVVSATISLDAKQSISSIKESNCPNSPLMCHGIPASSKVGVVDQEIYEQADKEENECMKDKASINSEQQQDQTEDEKEKDEESQETHGEKNELHHQLTSHNTTSVTSPSDGDNNDDDVDNGDSSRGSGDDLLIQQELAKGGTATNQEELMT